MNSIDKNDIKLRVEDDPVSAYERAGLPAGQVRRVGSNWQVRCPFHNDDTPSFTIFPDGGFRCFGCGATGDFIEFYMRQRGVHDFAAACEEAGRLLGVSPSENRVVQPIAVSAAPLETPTKPIENAVVEELHRRLLDDEKRLNWLVEKKGLPLSIVEVAKLGIGTSPYVRWGGDRYCIPVPDLNDGEVWVDIRGYRPKAEPKIMPWEKGRGRPTLYPWAWVSGYDTIVWCEGELDALNLIGRGIAAVTSTCGVDGALGVLKLPDLSGKTFLVCGDDDPAGQRLNEKLPPKLLLAGAARVEVVCWKDVCDDSAT